MLNKVPILRNHFNNHTVELIEGASVAFVMKVLGAGLSFAFSILLARLLGAEGTGLYLLALTVANVATILGRMGLSNTLLRFTAANAATGQWDAVKGAYQGGMKLAIIASGVSTLIMFIVAPWLAEAVFVKPELAEPMRWMALSIVPTTLLMLHAEMLKGLKRIRDSQLIDGVAVPALSLIGLYLLGRAWDVVGAVWAYTAATGLVALLGFWLWRVAAPQLRDMLGHFDRRELMQSSMPMLWVTMMTFVTTKAATFFLGIWGTSAEVGIFGVASRTAMLTSFILLAVNSIAAPKFAALYQQGDIETLGSAARTAARIITILTSPLLLLLFLVPGRVLALFGPQFVNGTMVLTLLAIGQLTNAITGSTGPLLAMSGNEPALRNNVAIAAIINIILSVALIPLMGMVGAAVATTVSMIVLNLHAVHLVHSRLKIWPTAFALPGKSLKTRRNYLN